jgi:hypothetical protein
VSGGTVRWAGDRPYDHLPVGRAERGFAAAGGERTRRSAMWGAGLALASLVACSPPEPSAALRAMDGDLAAIGVRAQRELRCDDGPMVWLCPMRGLPGRRPEVPDAPLGLLGFQLVVRPSVPLERSAYASAAVAVLSIDPTSEPPKAAFAVITSDEGRSSSLQVAVAGALGRVLRGNEAALNVPPGAQGLTRMEIPDANHLFELPDALGGDGEEPFQVVRVDGEVPLWVAWRAVGEGGFLGLFPAVPLEILPPPPGSPAAKEAE